MKTFLRTLTFFCFIGAFGPTAFSQGLNFFFAAGDLSGEPDRFGNTHTISPMDAIDPRPFGNEELEDVFFDEDGLWLIYTVDGNTFLASHGPGFFEDAPELTMDITVALEGRYEVIFQFMDSNDDPDTGPIQAALGDNELVQYSDMNAERASGGTTPGYPAVGGVTEGNMFWYSVSLGEVELGADETVSIRVDDVQGDTLDLLPAPFVTSTFRGVTLRVIELSGGISEIQVSPGSREFATDVSGNQFRTWPADEDAFPTEADWLTINDRQDGSGLWNIREGLGPYGPILESFPNAGNDATMLKTSVIFAESGSYNAYLNVGDTAASTASENCEAPNPLRFGLSPDNLSTYIAADGNFKGTPGYNDYEIPVGVVSANAGEQIDFFIDDAVDFENTQRSVYLGMRFEKINPTGINEIQVSPGSFDWATDLSGNRFRTMPSDICLNQEDWLTITDREDGSGKWNIREGLGPYGPILESFPEAGNDAFQLTTSVIFASGGTYDAFLNIGDTAASDPAENAENPNPLKFSVAGEELQTLLPDDGEFISTPGYNDYEVPVGQFSVEAGDRLDFNIDDADLDFENVRRSVYLGMRFELVEGTGVKTWSLY